jgi:lactate dehydrogenase-like 2-hydroxyacid dehydrogenase
LAKMKVLYPWPGGTPPAHRVVADAVMARLKQLADVDNTPHPRTKEGWIAKIKDVNAAVNVGGIWNWEEFLDAAPHLGMVQNAFVGYDNIDVAACTKHGVLVCNVPEDMSEAVAQHAMALILDVSKKVTSVDRAIRRDRGWTRGKIDVVGFELWGKTLGILGLGNIGGRIAMKLRGAFNMRILAYDPFLVPSEAQRYGATLVDLPTLVKEADVISVNCLLTRTGPSPTYHLLGANEFAMMKPTTVVVNTSRGSVIDEPALIAALKAGTIAAAGLDVFETEPITADNPLLDLDNVVLTAHQSSSSLEARIRTPASGMENVIRYVQGRNPLFVRNPAVLYTKKA